MKNYNAVITATITITITSTTNSTHCNNHHHRLKLSNNAHPTVTQPLVGFHVRDYDYSRTDCEAGCKLGKADGVMQQ